LWGHGFLCSTFCRRLLDNFNMEEKIRAHVFVFGRVQGVFYRQGAKEKAKGLGILGWVKKSKRRERGSGF
jgi:hypothetical protein